jgi:hypothetical protein
MANEQPMNVREKALVKLAGKKKMEIGCLGLELSYAEQFILKMAKDGRMTEEEIWKYVEEKPWGGRICCESSDLGIFSIIAPYTNKEGRTYPAHYTINNHYIRYVKNADKNQPISYLGWFRIKEYKDKLEFKMNPDAKHLYEFIVPKK